jgi:hypothetical protein
MALGYSLGIHYTGISVMFGIGLFTLWLLLAGYSLKGFPAKAILAITGHLRTRPDPCLEGALRTAFAEFDRELAVILQDRNGPARAWTDHAAGPAVARHDFPRDL